MRKTGFFFSMDKQKMWENRKIIYMSFNAFFTYSKPTTLT